MVLQAKQTRWRAGAVPEVSGGEDADPRGAAPEQEEEDTGQRVPPHMHRQIRQSNRQDRLLRRGREAQHRHRSKRRTAQRAEREEGARDQPQAHRAHQACEPDEAPECDERLTGAER